MGNIGGQSHQALGETAFLADGRVAVFCIRDSVGHVAVAQAAAMWSSGRAGLSRALQRGSLQHLAPALHKFYRTASDALVFVCHVDSDGDAKCHVLATSPGDAFGIAGVGQNYWVYKAGVVSRDAFIDTTSGGWLMTELPWTIPGLSEGESPPDLIVGLQRSLQDPAPYGGASMCPGIWSTCNNSVVAVSRLDLESWGATVVRGGHQFGEMPGASPGSHYRVTDKGAVIWPESEASELPKRLRNLVAISGLALSRRLDVCDPDGTLVAILDVRSDVAQY